MNETQLLVKLRTDHRIIKKIAGDLTTELLECGGHELLDIIDRAVDKNEVTWDAQGIRDLMVGEGATVAIELILAKMTLRSLDYELRKTSALVSAAELQRTFKDQNYQAN